MQRAIQIIIFDQAKLTLSQAKPMGSGVVLLSYEPAR